jgi:regulator of protease activity HflC (stomatin/prohibitin superfamily)
MLDQLLNFIAIASWAIFAFFVIINVVRGFQYGGLREGLHTLTHAWVLIGFFILIIISMLSASLVFIQPEEAGVVISILNPEGYRQQPLRSGLHWIVPLAERVVRYPIYWQTYTMSTEPMEGSTIGNDSIAARTSDGQLVYLDTSVIYKIDPNEVIRVHIDLQNRYVQDFIRPVMRAIIRTEVSQFTAEEVNSSKRKNLEANLEEELRSTFNQKGFILDRFLLRNIAFTPQYSSAIEQKQIAEQDQIQRQYQAEQMRALAAGERDKLITEAQGRADAAVLEGQAEAKVILLKAQAQAQALTLINQILEKNKDLITYQYVDKLAPGIKVMLVPSNNPFLLPIPDMGLNEPTPTITPTMSITGTMPSLGLPVPTPTITPTITPTPGY